MNYKDYEHDIFAFPIVKKGMLPWMGRHNVKHFIKYMLDEGFAINRVTSAVSTYKPGENGEVGFGTMDVRGICRRESKDYEFLAHFLSQGSYAEALLAVDEEDFESLDTFRSHAWLDSVEFFDVD